MFESLLSLLPQTPGLLPKWMFFISLVSVFNTTQCYLSSSTSPLNKRVYPLAAARGHVTPLSSRTFGTWTLLTGIVRLYACSRLEDQAWFDLAFWTYVVALGHFGAELLVYRSTRVDSGVFPSLVIAVGTVGWMGWVRDGYVQ